MLNLDTHILIYALNGQVSSKEKQILQNNEWGISSMVLWELTKLWQFKKITLNPQEESFKSFLSHIKVWPLSYEVCLKTLELDFKSDPADELIAATSLFYNTPLLTRDKKILKSNLVPLVKL